MFSGELVDRQARRQSVFDFGPPTRPVHAAAESVRLEVRAAPQHDGAWLPAAGVQIADELVPALDEFPRDQPITRIITLRVQGQLHTQLPRLDVQAPEGIRAYIDAPEEQTVADAGGLSAVQTYSVAMIPDRAGTLVLPEIRVPWWDVVSGQERMAIIPERRLFVAPAASSAQSSGIDSNSTAAVPANEESMPEGKPVARDAGSSLVWKLASVVGLFGWLLAGALLWRQRQRANQPAVSLTSAPLSASLASERKQLLAALRAGDASKIRQAMIQWCRCWIPGTPVVGLRDVIPVVDQVEVWEALAALDSSLYGSGRFEQAEVLTAWVAGWKAPPGRPKADVLPRLYSRASRSVLKA